MIEKGSLTNKLHIRNTYMQYIIHMLCVCVCICIYIHTPSGIRKRTLPGSQKNEKDSVTEYYVQLKYNKLNNLKEIDGFLTI